MRKFAFCCAFTLLCVAAVSAQESPSVTAVAAPQSGASDKAYSTEQFRWQLGFGYQFQKFDIGGASANQRLGTTTSVTYYFRQDWGWALEGIVTTGFSRNSPAGLDYHTIVYAAGAKYPFRRKGRYEPWVHALLGGAYVRHSQTISGPSSGKGLGTIVGGGVDIPIGSRFAARGETDFVGTRTFGAFQKSISISGGIVLYF
ncbi:MAG TPA: hypothetical protein VFO34_08955 [Candidatus Acidoferrales bacterium]|nr:hypothetical protein [Candidatus Acidoferrales bacterium]